MKPRRKEVTVAVGLALVAAIGLAAARTMHGRSTPQLVGSAASAPSPSMSPDASPTATALSSATPSASATVTVIASQCSLGSLTYAATTDRRTYRPGEVVKVTVNVTNRSAMTCWVSTRYPPSSSPTGAECRLSVMIHGYFNDTTPAYNALLGPFFPNCSNPRLVVPASQSSVVTVLAPFGVSGREDYPRVYLHEGTWEVIAAWNGVMAVGSRSPSTTIECDPRVCKGSPSPSPSPATTFPTVSPATSTTASSTPTVAMATAR